MSSSRVVLVIIPHGSVIIPAAKNTTDAPSSNPEPFGFDKFFAPPPPSHRSGSPLRPILLAVFFMFQLKVALEDVEALDEGLKQFMDGDGNPRESPRAAPLSWRRISATYLRPLVSCRYFDVVQSFRRPLSITLSPPAPK